MIKDPAGLPSLVLAYVGDAVFEVYVRTHLVEGKYKNVHDLHDKAVSFVSSRAQAGFYKRLEPAMTEGERAIAKRGRNAKSHRVPKSARTLEYRLSTGFEALIGYLFLSGQKERLEQLVGHILNEEVSFEDHEL